MTLAPLRKSPVLTQNKSSCSQSLRKCHLEGQVTNHHSLPDSESLISTIKWLPGRMKGPSTQEWEPRGLQDQGIPENRSWAATVFDLVASYHSLLWYIRVSQLGVLSSPKRYLEIAVYPPKTEVGVEALVNRSQKCCYTSWNTQGSCQGRELPDSGWALSFTAVILATCEAEIRRTVVPGQPRQKSIWDPISKEQSLAWWHTPVIPVTAESFE
jgi:hypothetical protein